MRRLSRWFFGELGWGDYLVHGRWIDDNSNEIHANWWVWIVG